MNKAITHSILALALSCSAVLAPVAARAQSDASLAVCKPSINRALFIDADEVQGLGYEAGSAMFQGSSAS